MGREARANVEGKTFHVLVRGLGDIKVFGGESMKGFYITCLGRATAKVGVNVLAYCVMDDHAHMLLSVESIENLSSYMTYANAMFAKWFNSSFGHSGKVFNDRYKCESINGNVEIADCVRFIQSDPIRLEIVTSLDNYRFNSFYDYVNKLGIVNIDLASRYFNPSPSAMRNTMHVRSVKMYMDTALKKEVNEDDVFGYVIDKYHIASEADLQDVKLLKLIATEIIDKTGMSMRELSTKLGVNREKLRRVMKSE